MPPPRGRPLLNWQIPNLIKNKENEINNMGYVEQMSAYRINRPGKVFKTAAERNAALKALKEEMRNAPWKPIRRAFKDTRVTVITPKDAKKMMDQRLVIIIGKDYAEYLLPEKNNDGNRYVLEYENANLDYLNPEEATIKSIDARGVWMNVGGWGNTKRVRYTWWSNHIGQKVLVNDDGYPVVFFGQLQHITKNAAVRKIQMAYRRYLIQLERIQLERARLREQRSRVHNELRALPPRVYHPSFPGGSNYQVAKKRFENMQKAERNLKRTASSNTGPSPKRSRTRGK